MLAKGSFVMLAIYKASRVHDGRTYDTSANHLSGRVLRHFLVKQTEGQGKWLPNYAFVTRKIVLRAKINKHLTFSPLTYRRTIHDVDRKYKYLFNPIFQYILTEQSVNKLSGVLQYQQLTTQQIELANISCRVAKK